MLLHWKDFHIFCINSDYREVPDEVYKILDAVGGDEKWWEVITLNFDIFIMVSNDIGRRISGDFGFTVCLQAVELQKLILAHNDIELLKEDLRNLSSLAVLNLCHNKLSHLPAAIGEYAF